nr:hypothetical protein 13 [bacterium]
MEAERKALERWRFDPVAFVRDNFGVEPDPWQEDFLIAYNENPRVAAKACKGPGKTAVLAWCAWHFLATRPLCKIAVTSISGQNLKDGLWTELSKWQQKSPYLLERFEHGGEYVRSKIYPKVWYISARTYQQQANKEKQADTLAGLHADYIMFILDEAGGMTDAVMAAAKAVMASGIENKLLMCGNPTDTTGPLYRACTRERSKWHVIEITGDPDNPKRSSRISIDWARDMIEEYGVDHPYVLVNVFGKFPPAGYDALLGPEEMEEAMARKVPKGAYETFPRIVGIDVALQGDDRTVVAPRQGMVAFKPQIFRIADPLELAGRIAPALHRWKPHAVFVDATGGYGSGVKSELANLGFNVIPVYFSGKPADNQYFNKRSEMAFLLAKWIKSGGALPNLPDLVEEGTAIKYFPVAHRDQIRIEEKKIIKERLGRSPDLFDAYGLTFAHPVQVPDPFEHLHQPPEYHPFQKPPMQVHRQIVDEYNPFG